MAFRTSLATGLRTPIRSIKTSSSTPSVKYTTSARSILRARVAGRCRIAANRSPIPLFHRNWYTNPVQTPSRKMLPLDGVTVVSLEHAIAAPFCTRQLADLGARVIKVERPGVGDFARSYDTRVRGLASHFVWTNRSKESLALDVKNPRDFEVLRALLAKADVLVQNLAPGASQRLGLSFDDLKDEHPGLIVCDISGYGSDGPYRDKKAYDLLVQSEAGLLSVTGTPTEPAKVGISVADISAGTFACQNILAALLKRGKTGKGSHIDISMLEAMTEWMSFPLYYAFEGAPGPDRAGAAHAAIYPYGPFATSGGGSVMLGIQNEREWTNLCAKVLENAELAKDKRFVNNSQRTKNRDDLKAIILEAFSTLEAEEVLARLDNAGIANAKVNDMQGVWDHPQLRARGRWTEIDTPAGKVPALLPPGAKDADSVRMDAVPALGQHNAAIFEELGFSQPNDSTEESKDAILDTSLV
ncbi:CoA-transferase family III domain-containing protein [Ilyonectria sp. MPI-CAGE-AT-0026]|nr:CoA-transferase family III domain-containing protein [Ilyonectria sp. MPI-CAGE-AT-0026]